MVGAIVMVGSSEPISESGAPAGLTKDRIGFLACVEVLGRTVLGRTIEELVLARFDSVDVIANGTFASAILGEEKVAFSSSMDIWRSASERIAVLQAQGAEAVLIIRLGGYIEFDPAELLQFHRESGKPLIRASDDRGPLDLWVIDPCKISDDNYLPDVLHAEKSASYPVRGYVNRLESPRDVRQLISDGLSARCQFRPQGFEVKPGVWMAPGAQVERGARIVAPAFIGRNSKVADQCLITRGSNIESNSHIDYGTVIEDSSVLSNTYVGIGLDLAHSIVDGFNLLNLQHGVILKISDPVVLRHLRAVKTKSDLDDSFWQVSKLGA